MDDLDLNLSKYDPYAVEQDIETGGKLPAGKYHARLDKAEVKAWPSGDSYTDVTYTVLAGKFAGKTISDKLDHLKEVGEHLEEKKKKAIANSNNRFLLFGSRLGLIASNNGKYQRVKGSFADCCGAEAVIDVVHKPDRTDPTKTYANVSFAGIFTLSDPKVKDVPRAKPGEAAAVPAASVPAAGFDTDDL